MDDRTIGRVFTAPDGKTYRPSMFLTLTLPPTGGSPPRACPVDPDSYDYRRAALDAMHFPKLVDRFWQNLRRCAGYQVQYFATVEAQRRLAPHLHAAVRGAIPRRSSARSGPPPTTRSGGRAHDGAVYVGDRLPRWSPDERRLRRPVPGAAPDLGRGARPARRRPRRRAGPRGPFREQDDIQGLLAGTPDADRTIHYLCKYLTKDIAGTHDDDDVSPAREAAHRPPGRGGALAAVLATCANWLRYGVQPKDARPGWRRATARQAHDRRTSASAAAGSSCPASGRARPWPATRPTGPRSSGPRSKKPASTPTTTTSSPSSGTDGRWSWELLGRTRVDDGTYAAAIAEAIDTRQRWRAEYEAAKAARAGPARPLAARRAGSAIRQRE